MKFKKNIFKMFMAFVLCISGLIGSSGIHAVSTTATVAEPNTLNMDIKKLVGSAYKNVDMTNEKLAISEIDKGKVTITYQGGNNTTGNMVTLTIPYYYSFDNVLSSNFYTSYQVSNVNGGESNKIILAMSDAISDKSNPETVSFDFTLKLNRNSIDATREENWQNGLWNPNDEAKEFILEHNSSKQMKAEMQIVQKDFDLNNNIYLNLKTIPSADRSTSKLKDDTVFRYGSDSNIFKDGGGSFSGSNSRVLIYSNISYRYPDIYTYSPINFDGIKYKVILPNEFEFGDWVPSDFTSLHSTISISADKKAATLILKDVSNSSTTLDRILNALEIRPSGEYATGGKVYPSQAKYPVKLEITDKNGVALVSKEQFINVVDYIDNNMMEVKPSGKLDERTKKIILDTKKPGETIGSYNNVRLSNNRLIQSQSVNEINTDGKDTIVTQTYDSNLRINSIRLKKDVSDSYYNSYIAGNTWKSYSYSTNKRSNVIGLLSENQLTLTDKDEYFTSLSITYEKFSYIQEASIVEYITGKITEKNLTTNEDWKPGDDIPITTTIKDKGGVELAQGINYIRIKDVNCPPFTTGFTVANKVLGVGEYSNNEAVISAALYLDTPYVGVPKYENGSSSSIEATYLDVLENPKFSIGGKFGGETGGRSGIKGDIITNGKVNLAPIMGDGKWTVLMKTQSAKGAKENNALKEYTITLPKFSKETKIDLKKLANILDDEYIVWLEMSHAGDLDISSLSNYYTDDTPAVGKAVNKMFFTVENTNYDKSPLSGQYYSNKIKEPYTHITYENCKDIDNKHDLIKEGFLVDSSGSKNKYTQKGAETLSIAAPNIKYSTTLQQGASKNLNIQVNPKGVVSSSEYKFLSTGGEDFYFQLTDSSIKYLSFAKTATIDGLKIDTEIVDIDGISYLKMTNPKRDQYEKKRVAGEPGFTSFEAYEIDIQVFSAPITPTNRVLKVFRESFKNNYGIFVDWKNAAYQEYELNGKTIRNAFFLKEPDNLGTGVPGGKAWVAEYNGTYNRYANLYKDTDFLDRQFISDKRIPFETSIGTQALQGVVLNPGVNGNYTESHIQIRPWERDKLSTSLSLIAGQSEVMKGLSSTIALPRSGKEVEDGGIKYTSDVSLYLSGPITISTDFGNSTSTKPVFKYSTDNGKTYVEEDKITDWSKVSDFSIYVSNIAIGDGGTFIIPMETNDKDKELGKAYMPAQFETTTLTSQSNRLNIYDFIGYEMSGTAWDDINKDGMIDATEPKREAIMELYQDYGTDKETLIATTTSDAVSGNYEFMDLKEYERLTLVSNLPAKKTTTALTDTTDNKFKSDGKGYAVHKFVKIDKDQHNIDYGIRDLIEVVIGGSDATTAITGKKTISGSLENSDILKDQYTFNIVANANNPINGTENIPASISNDASTTAGANLSFTGMNGWTFAKEGTYKFTLSEVDPALKGHKFDQSVYEVTIVVSEKIENGVSSGKLQQTTTITKDGANIAIDDINFENIANVYKVNYDTNGGQPSLIAAKTNVNWNDKNLLPASNPTKVGHTFAGWEVKTTTKSLSDVTNDDTYNALVQDDDMKNEITLKAKWTKNEYQVSWVSEDVNHGTLTPENTSENVKYDEFATTDITVTPNIAADQWVFTGWEYNYLPDGKADVPANYIKGVTQDYKSIEVKGNIVFTAKFAKKPFVNVDSVHGYVAIKDGTTLPTIPNDVADKKTNAKIEYDESNANAKSVAIAFENQRHHHLEKVTISDLYGNSKIIYTNIKGEIADTSFVMKDSTLNVDFSDTGSLKVSNIKNSLNVHFTFKEDPKYNVNFYTQSKENVEDTTIPYASNEGLYSGDEYGAQPGVDPIKEGYTFSGWSTDGKNVNYKSTDQIANDHVKVYAIWNEKSYAVKYNLNGGYYKTTTSIPDYMTSFNGANLLPNENPVKDGYAFDGWYYNGIKLTNAMKYKDLVADDTVDSIALSAKWTGNTYQVEFDKNSAKAKGNMALQEFTYGENKALSINEYARVGYTFAGWATSADGAVMYTDKQQVENLTEEQGGIVKLYAVWNANGDTMYKIEHYKQQNNGTWKTTPDDVANMSGKSDTEANAILKTETDAGYENYIFDVNNAKNIVKGSIEADGTLVLKVYYRQVLDVEFDTNGGQTNIPSQRVVFGDSAKEPSNPIRDGYTFIGWFNTANNSTWNFDDAVESNMVLKAQWEKIEVPATPDKPGTNTTPDTGDTTNAKALLGLLGSSMFVLAVMWRRRKKQEIKNL